MIVSVKVKRKLFKCQNQLKAIFSSKAEQGINSKKDILMLNNYRYNFFVVCQTAGIFTKLAKNNCVLANKLNTTVCNSICQVNL